MRVRGSAIFPKLMSAKRSAIQIGTSQASLMEIILRESDRLNKIITNFLTYARPRVSNFSEIDVREAIGDTDRNLAGEPDGDYPARIGSAEQNHHEFFNLCASAGQQFFRN